jgi:hypothetical protein
VLLHIDKDGDEASWTITRTDDNDTAGLKISGNGRDEGCGCVRRRVSEEEVVFVFGQHYEPYTCFLLRGDNKKAVFSKGSLDQDEE